MTPRQALVLGIIATLALTGFAGITATADTTTEPTATDLDCGYPLTTTDATNTSVTLTDQPQRIVVLGASATQTLWELGAADRIVGLDTYSTYLDGLDDVPVVSQGINDVDYEATFEQEPDLIIVDGNSYTGVTPELRQSSVPVIKLETVSSLDGVINKTRTVGQLIGNCGQATDVATTMTDRIATIDAAVADEPTPTLFYDLGSAQGEARFSVGPTTFIGELIATSGATNIVSLGNFSSPYPQVSNEYILRQNPEWLLVTYTPGSEFGAATPEEARAAVANSSVLSETQADENGNIITVNANHLNQPAPRVVDALTTIVEALHPTAYRAANTTPTTTTTTTTTTPTTTATSTTGADGPGFTVSATLIAVLAVLVVRRH